MPDKIAEEKFKANFTLNLTCDDCDKVIRPKIMKFKEIQKNFALKWECPVHNWEVIATITTNGIPTNY